MLFNSIIAGVLIGVGGFAYLMCSNPVVGSFLFSFGLLSICYNRYYLYTGKIGALVEDRNNWDMKKLGTTLMLNLLGAWLMGKLCLVIGSIEAVDKAMLISQMRIESQWYTIFIKAVCCGLLIYLGVAAYGRN